jgi:phosphate-selective porin OprO/OprP
MRKVSWCVGLLGACALFALPGAETAQAEDKALDELKARLERLEQQNKELTEQIKGSGPYKPEEPKQDKEQIQKIVGDYLKERDEKKKAEDKTKKAQDDAKKEAEKRQKEAEGVKVGSDLAISARWASDQGLWFETKNKDFVSHLGFYFQWDTVAFSQSANLRPIAQLGDLQDGTFFRRLRPQYDGRAWDFAEWNVILALEQIQGSAVNGLANINVDEVWGGVYGIPIIGRVRAGHMKVPQGLEGNQWSSSRAMTFNENAAYTDAFYNIFAVGVQILNSGLDDGVNGDRMTWQLMGYRNDNPRTNDGEDFGDGDYAATGRISGLLIDEDQDRHFLHVGVSGTWRKAQRANADLGGPRVEQFRARPELRDGIGGFGDASGLPGDTNRMVDTGVRSASAATVIGTELWYNLGPFNVMAEWAFATMNSAVVPVTVGRRTTNVVGDRNFHGGYVTVSYFLTGESQVYDHLYGRRGTFYIARPFTNAWAKRKDDGGVSLGWGAWEVAARYSYLNLNDGPIQGGVLSCWTVGLNWYLNSNLKVQFEYIRDNRWDKTTPGGGTVPGFVEGFGTRMQIQF